MRVRSWFDTARRAITAGRARFVGVRAATARDNVTGKAVCGACPARRLERREAQGNRPCASAHFNI
jgi:hypothetical protein